MKKFRVYGISGLGADSRVFDRLTLDHELIPVDWIAPLPDESISAYSTRLMSVIDQSLPVVLIGVSFGGLIAVEIAKQISPIKTILISSTDTAGGLRSIYKGVGKTNVISLLPEGMFDMPRALAAFVFGTEEREMLNSILDDTDLAFTKWAVNALTQWSNTDKVPGLIKINGTDDKLIPLTQSDYVIEGGAHFMIVDRAEEIGTILMSELIKIEL